MNMEKTTGGGGVDEAAAAAAAAHYDEYYDEEYYDEDEDDNYDDDYNNNNNNNNNHHHHNYQLCAACGLESEFVDQQQEGSKMLTCSYCNQVVYCSKECMEWHWDNQHQKECTPSSSSSSGGNNNSLMMMMMKAQPPPPTSSSTSCGSSTSVSTSSNDNTAEEGTGGHQQQHQQQQPSRTIAIIEEGAGDPSESSHNCDFLQSLDPNSPAARLQRIYNQDNGFIDSEFEAYAQDYYAKKHLEREQEEYERKKKKLIPLLLWMGVLVLVVTIFALALVYHSKMEQQQQQQQQQQQDGGGGENINNSTTNTTKPLQVLSPPPADILKYCNPFTIAESTGGEGRQKCSEICYPAQCCYMNEMNPKHCWRDNLKICHEYRKACAVLSPLKEYAHDNHDDTTTAATTTHQHSDNNNNNNSGGSSTAAAAAAATSTTNNNNPVLSLYKTTVYPNAVVLFDKPELLPPAPSTLLTSCKAGFLFDDPWNSPSPAASSSTSQNVMTSTLTCHEVCYRASCCWDDRLTNPGDRCWTHPHCEAYAAACSFLLNDPRHVGQEEHHAVVSSQHNNNNHNDNNNAAVAAVASPTQVCSDYNRAHSSLDDLLQCQQACLPSECCWNSVFTKKCNDQQGQCKDGVEACSVLDGSSTTSSTSTTTLSPTTATPSTTTTSTTTTAAPSLNDFTHSSSATTSSSSGDLYTYETIRDACWNHDNSIQTPGHKSLCEQVCQAGSCCFQQQHQQEQSSTTTTTSTTCPGYLPTDFCSKYEPCLVISLTGDSLQTQIEDACSNRDDLSDCVELCGEGTCCFTNDPWKTCVTTSPDTVCSNYAACEILYNNKNKSKNNGGETTQQQQQQQQGQEEEEGRTSGSTTNAGGDGNSRGRQRHLLRQQQHLPPSNHHRHH